MTKFGVGQLCSGGNARENLKTIARLVQQASREHCKMLFLPESSDFIDGEYVDLTSDLQSLSRQNKMWLSVGIHAPNPNGSKYYNRMLVLNDKGEVAEHYDKIHLFELLKEGDRFERGREVKVADTPLGYVGLGICYDLRFPRFSWKLREMGSQLLAFPSAFTIRTGEHFEPLLRARAIETQCYVAAAAQCGKHGSSDGARASFGNSLIIDPWGKVIARATETPQLITAELDTDLLERVRSQMPVLDHAQNDIF